MPFILPNAGYSASDPYLLKVDTVAGMQMWFKADAGITKDGSDLVSTWADQSGNNRNLTQGTGSLQPLYVPNIINGTPIIRFASDEIINTVSGFTFTHPWTVFIVGKFNDITGQAIMVAGGSYVLEVESSKFAVWDGFQIGTTAADTNFHRWQIIADTSASHIITDNTDVAGNLQGGYLQNLYVGSRGSGAGFAQCDIAEIIIYNTHVSVEDTAKVNLYFRDKYALF